MNPYRIYQSFKFLFVGPIILAFLFVINVMTSPGHWWIQWPALGIGLVWIFSLFRVLKAIVMAGGVAAFLAYVSNKRA